MKMRRVSGLAATSLVVTACGLPAEATMNSNMQAEARFAELEQLAWNQVFHDPGTGTWQEKWQLDGEKARVENTPEGMVFTAGPTEWDHSCHAVLWTREAFRGDLRVDYEFTRMDDLNRWVNIIYLQATGLGEEPYTEDIADWAELRTVPTMDTYFKHMHLLHISYCAYGKEDTTCDNDYVRARRYPVPPDGVFSKDTDIPPDYFRTGLFKTGRHLPITVIKKDHELYMRVGQGDDGRIFAWDTSGYPAVTEGRIGLRHMWMRSSRYRDFRISTLSPEVDAP